MRKSFLFITAFHIISIFCIAQVAPETMLDASFGKDGRIIIPDTTGKFAYQTLFDKLTQQGNKIIAAGFRVGNVIGYDSFMVVRFNNDGSLDKSFGANGFSFFKHAGDYEIHDITDMQCQSNGNIIINTQYWGPIYLWNLTRLLKNGTLDTTFGESGYIKNPPHTNAMLVLPDDKILRAYYPEDNIPLGVAIDLLDKNGKLITTNFMGVDKSLQSNYYGNMRFRLTNDNKVLLASQFFGIDARKVIMLRYLSNGNLDSSFGNKGQAYISDTGQNPFDGEQYNLLADITPQKNNKIVVGFYNSYSFRARRMNADGSIDSTFGTKGLANILFGFSSQIQALQTQSDDKIVAFGYGFARRLQKFSMARFTANGSIDSSFGRNGQTQTNFYINGTTINSFGTDMLIQSDGKILACGYTIYNPKNSKYYDLALLARYLPEKLSNNSIAKSAIVSPLKPNASTISISPNPVKDILNITSKNLSYKNISVIDASGKVVLKDGFAGSNHSINVSRLSAGVYYMQMMNDDKKETIKFIKQ